MIFVIAAIIATILFARPADPESPGGVVGAPRPSAAGEHRLYFSKGFQPRSGTVLDGRLSDATLVLAMIWIGVSNLVLILASIGFLYPWACAWRDILRTIRTYWRFNPKNSRLRRLPERHRGRNRWLFDFDIGL